MSCAEINIYFPQIRLNILYYLNWLFWKTGDCLSMTYPPAKQWQWSSCLITTKKLFHLFQSLAHIGHYRDGIGFDKCTKFLIIFFDHQHRAMMSRNFSPKQYTCRSLISHTQDIHNDDTFYYLLSACTLQDTIFVTNTIISYGILVRIAKLLFCDSFTLTTLSTVGK